MPSKLTSENSWTVEQQLPLSCSDLALAYQLTEAKIVPYLNSKACTNDTGEIFLPSPLLILSADRVAQPVAGLQPKAKLRFADFPRKIEVHLHLTELDGKPRILSDLDDFNTQINRQACTYRIHDKEGAKPRTVLHFRRRVHHDSPWAGRPFSLSEEDWSQKRAEVNNRNRYKEQAREVTREFCRQQTIQSLLIFLSSGCNLFWLAF